MATRRPNNVLLYDQYGKTISPGFRASLYANPATQPQYRPRYYGSAFQDTWKAVDVGTRRNLVSVSRELSNQIPNVAASIEAKASWVVGDGWRPRFHGENTAWGDDATNWLFNQWFPIFNAQGQQYDFRQSMKLCAKALITDGDVLMVFTQTKNNFPLIKFVPTHNIGCRYGEKIIKDGSGYDGLRIVDGVVINDASKPVAYRVTGEKPEDDYYIPSQSCYLIFEPNSFSEFRGIPKLAPAILDAMTLQDVEVLMQRGIRTSAAIGLLHYNEAGEAPVGSYSDPSAEEVTCDTTQQPLECPAQETLYGGDIMYLKSESGKLEEWNSQRPHPNVLGYLSRLEEGMLNAIGWSVHLLNPAENGGAGQRIIKENANKAIFDTQNILTRPMKLAVVWGVANAMSLNIVKDNRKDAWYDWEFDYPSEFIIDAGADRSADVEAVKLGLMTQKEVNAKWGKSYIEVRNQKQSEVEDLYARAETLQMKFPQRTFEQCLNDLSQLTPNGVPSVPQPTGAKK